MNNRRAELNAVSCGTLQQPNHNLHLFFKIIQLMKAKHNRNISFSSGSTVKMSNAIAVLKR